MTRGPSSAGASEGSLHARCGRTRGRASALGAAALGASWVLLVSAGSSGCFLVHGPSDPADAAVVDAAVVDGGPSDCEAGTPCDCRAVSLVPTDTHWVGVAADVSSTPYYSPAHRVTLSRDLYAATYEASVACYRRCLAEGACREPEDEFFETLTHVEAWHYGERYWENTTWDDLPMAGLTWAQARDYCTWLGGRLLTNAEHERLARSTDGRLNPWSEPPADPTRPNSAFLHDACDRMHYPDYQCDAEQGAEALVPIDAYPSGRSPYGPYNVLGNAAEWVADTAATYAPEDQVDPLDDAGDDQPHVIRGRDTSGWMRSSELEFAAVREPLGVRCAFDAAPMPLPAR